MTAIILLMISAVLDQQFETNLFETLLTIVIIYLIVKLIYHILVLQMPFRIKDIQNDQEKNHKKLLEEINILKRQNTELYKNINNLTELIEKNNENYK